MNNIYQSYYTKSDSIVDYMVSMLDIKPGMRIFEPCAGNGVFIDALNSKSCNFSIDMYDLNPEAITVLKSKYSKYSNINITPQDTILCPNLLLFSEAGGIYDRIIANPPYGGKQDLEKKTILKKLYPLLYVKETYIVFLFRCIELLRENGILVFIIPDTFLNLHMHTNFRKYLLKNTLIKEICLFPSSFFPGVNFGYANLSIITLQKCSDSNKSMNNSFNVVTGFKIVEELSNFHNSHSIKLKHYTFQQSDIYNNIDHALFINDNPKVTCLINKCELRMQDIANCVTGFYSGNDKIYLKVMNNNIKNGKKYETITKNMIYDKLPNNNEIINGISYSNNFVPIVKGGNNKYIKKDNWFMDWSIKAVANYKTNNKARFQNSDYYYKLGIAVPMISSSQITAALIETKLFDQSIVGVFLKKNWRKYLYYLLAFFNSSTCNILIRTINPSANNPANYIKKIPFIVPSQSQFNEIDKITKSIINEIKKTQKYNQDNELVIDKIFKSIYSL